MSYSLTQKEKPRGHVVRRHPGLFTAPRSGDRGFRVIVPRIGRSVHWVGRTSCEKRADASNAATAAEKSGFASRVIEGTATARVTAHWKHGAGLAGGPAKSTARKRPVSSVTPAVSVNGTGENGSAADSGDCGHPFQPKVDSNSDGSWTAIPEEFGQSFRRKVIG